LGIIKDNLWGLAMKKNIESMNIVEFDLPEEKSSAIDTSFSIACRKFFVMPKLVKQGKLLAITGTTPGETSHN